MKVIASSDDGVEDPLGITQAITGITEQADCVGEEVLELSDGRSVNHGITSLDWLFRDWEQWADTWVGGCNRRKQEEITDNKRSVQ